MYIQISEYLFLVIFFSQNIFRKDKDEQKRKFKKIIIIIIHLLSVIYTLYSRVMAELL